MLKKLTSLALVLFSFMAEAIAIKGFVWYEQQQLKLMDKEVTNSKSEAKNRNQALAREFDQAVNLAIDQPTLKNAMIAQRLQKQLTNKAQRFANSWSLAALYDFQLTRMDEHHNILHRKIYQQQQEQQRSKKLSMLAKDYGLILQFSEICQFCHSFAPIVQQFAGKYNFQLLAVSASGRDFLGIKGIKDRGQMQALNPKAETPMLYLVHSSGRLIYPIARGIIDEDAIIDNIFLLDKHYNRLIP